MKRWSALAQAALAFSIVRAAVDAVARRYALAGEVLGANGHRVLLRHGYGTIVPAGGARHKAGGGWRLASITRQVTAAPASKSVGFAGPGRPLAGSDGRYPPGRLTLRRLLTHRTGLASRDATPKPADGGPSFRRRFAPRDDYCSSVPARPGAASCCNNRDSVAAESAPVLLGGRTVSLPANLRWAREGERAISGFVGGRPEPAFQGETSDLILAAVGRG